VTVVLENIMRFTSVSAALALAAVSISTSLHGQRPDDQIDARSVALVERAKAARAAGNLPGANDLLESAAVVDPRNRQAFVLLAEIARQQDLPGKSIRFYREALTIEPNDPSALAGQGQALVDKGAIERAKENLAKIRTLCAAKPCGEAVQLAAAIAKGPPVTATAQQSVTPTQTPAGKN
jgi:Tfp pilus assembly protein PilF